MVSLLLISIGMDKRRQGSAVDDQPWDEGPKLLRSEEVDLEHANGVRAKRSVPDSVHAKLGNW